MTARQVDTIVEAIAVEAADRKRRQAEAEIRQMIQVAALTAFQVRIAQLDLAVRQGDETAAVLLDALRTEGVRLLEVLGVPGIAEIKAAAEAAHRGGTTT